MFGNFFLDYLYVCLAEEGLFRMAPMEAYGKSKPLLAFTLAIIPYALLHFIKFNWIVVLLCVPLAFVLCLIYYNLRRPWGYLVCTAVHFVLGVVAYLLQIT